MLPPLTQGARSPGSRPAHTAHSRLLNCAPAPAWSQTGAWCCGQRQAGTLGSVATPTTHSTCLQYRRRFFLDNLHSAMIYRGGSVGWCWCHLPGSLLLLLLHWARWQSSWRPHSLCTRLEQSAASAGAGPSSAARSASSSSGHGDMAADWHQSSTQEAAPGTRLAQVVL